MRIVWLTLWISVLAGGVWGQTCDLASLCYDCENTEQDLYVGFVCDGEEDCEEGDDEGDCDGTFTCDSGEELSDKAVCNALLECTSGLDEKDCDHCSDTENFYECPGSKVCLHRQSYVCDGYAHCDDNSDEASCECDSSHQFECGDGQCVLNGLVCDGEEDCEDGTDEADCGTSCSDSEFQCLDYESCVSESVRCDGTEDCNDGSDEWYCVSLDQTTGAVLVMYQGEKTSVCAEEWNSDWNDMVCEEMGLGTSDGDDTTSQASVSAYTANGFILPQAMDDPSSLLDLLEHGDTCEGDVVTLTCNDDACGSRSQPELERRRLLQGDDAQLGDFPWQVGMVYEGRHNCGGSLISPQWVLTAAHCVDFDLDPDSHEVRLGTTESYGTTTHLQTQGVAEIHMHEDYDNETLIHDIALLKLSSPVTITNYVRPVCLPSEGEIFPTHEFVECYTSGWGGINKEATLYPARLQELKMSLVSDGDCASNSDISSAEIFEADEMICAGYDDNFATICNGDSGGPLVCRSRTTNTWTQAGVVSWGPTSEEVSCMGYGVYAQTDYYQSWIAGFDTGATLTPKTEVPETTDAPGTAAMVTGHVWCTVICLLIGWPLHLY